MSPPKIEEIDNHSDTNVTVSKPKKNPFATRPKKVTVKRTVDEAYPQRKGLNKPQFKPTKPIDILFDKLQKQIDLPYDKLNIDELYNRFQISGPDDLLVKRYVVVERLLDELLEIQRLSMNVPQTDDKNLMAISLHDIKTFSKLVNLIIIHGIYPPLNVFRIGVEFEKRQLKNISDSKKTIKLDTLPRDNIEYIEKLLVLVYDKFSRLFLYKSDVADLLFKGTGFTDFLIVAMTLITVPNFNSSHIDISKVESLASTFELFQIYTLIMASSSPQPFKRFVMSRLELLHYSRSDGLLTLVEFVLGLRDQEEINIEKFEHVSNVVLLKPKSVDTRSYFTSVGAQIYNLLININRPTITSCVSFVLEKLWQRNKLVASDFVLKKIWENFNPSPREVEILVTEADLNNSINVILSLTKKGMEPDLYQAVIEPIILPLWGYYLFLKQNKKPFGIISDILTSYFTIMKDFDSDNIAGLLIIAKNLLYEHGEDWKYEIGDNDLVQIVQIKPEFTSTSKETKVNKFIDSLDFACESLINLLQELDDSLIQKLFVSILKSWLNKDKVILGGDEPNPFLMLVDLRLLESIGEKFKDKLATNPIDMLQLVDSFLGSSKAISSDDRMQEVDSDDEDDDNEEGDDEAQLILPVLLQLLSAILSENDIIVDDQCSEVLSNIMKSLLALESTNAAAGALRTRIQDLVSGNHALSADNELDNQRQILSRAITSLNDPLVPIRAHGLYLLRQLVEKKSTVTTLDFVINLHLVQLKDPEPFIYLNVIKGLENLLEWDKVGVLQKLCKIYLNDDDEGDTDLDERVKIGEVLLRFIKHENELFGGESAELIINAVMKLIRKVGNEERDHRLDMSALSILGECVTSNIFAVNINEVLDCCIGVLDLEKSSIIRRAAIVVIHDVLVALSEKENIEFPADYRDRVKTALGYTAEFDKDYLTKEHAKKVLTYFE